MALQLGETPGEEDAPLCESAKVPTITLDWPDLEGRGGGGISGRH